MFKSGYGLLGLLVGLAALFVIVWGVQNASSILNPILLAVVITITVLPLPTWFRSRGMPAWLAIVLTLLIILGVFLLVGALIALSLAQINERLPALLVPGLSAIFPGVETQAQVESALDAIVNEVTQETNLTRYAGLFGNVLVSVGSAVVAIFTTMLIFIFMLAAAVSLPGGARQSIRFDIPGFEQFVNLTSDVRRYMAVTTGINFLVGLGNTILLAALGIPYSIVWGVLSWFMGYVPAVGFWIALIPPLFLAFVDQGLRTAIIVFAGYVLINGTVENVLKPRVFGDTLRISPVVVFLSLIIWSWLLGAIGAILAIPLTLLILTVLENVDATKWMAALMRFTGRERPDAEAVGRVESLWRRTRAGLESVGLVRPASPPPATGEAGD